MDTNEKIIIVEDTNEGRASLALAEALAIIGSYDIVLLDKPVHSIINDYKIYKHDMSIYFPIKGYCHINFAPILRQITNDEFNTANIDQRRYWETLNKSYSFIIKRNENRFIRRPIRQFRDTKHNLLGLRHKLVNKLMK